MSAYTPGPWKYTPHHFPHARGHIYMERARGACTIELTGAASMSQAELDAHGALIAAAPDLADVLRELFEHCAMTHRHWGEGCNQKQSDEAQARARAILSTIEGK